MGAVVTGWPITEDTDLYQQGIRKYVLGYDECATFDETIWRSSGIAILPNVNCS